MAAQSNLLPKGVATDDTLHQTFNFESLPVRATSRNGEIWFVAADVCAALEITNPRHAVSRLDDDEKGVITVDTLGGPQETVIISESGLYSLTLTSRKEEAKRFKRWITHEVLPAIRKTGGYAKPTADAERIKLAHSLAAEVAAVASRTVFEAVLSDDSSWKHDRWMFCLNYSRDNECNVPWAKKMDQNAMVVSMADLPRRLLEPNGMLPTNKELADLAAACNQRLAQRMTYEANKAAGTGVMKP